MTDNQLTGPPETDENILIVDVSDDALERAAAVADGPCITLVYCTQDLSCGDV